jgi:hypothetical protein
VRARICGRYGERGLADQSREPVLAQDHPRTAHLEGIRLDPKSRRSFANVPTSEQIAAVDLQTGAVTT